MEERVRPMSISMYPSTKERLLDYKAANGFPSLDKAINHLLDKEEETNANQERK